MIVLLTLLVCWRLSAAGTSFMQRSAPTSIVVRHLRSHRGIKWAIPAALVLTSMYLLAAHAFTVVIDRGGPAWLHLFVMLFIWNGMKFALNGALSPLLLARAQRHGESLPLNRVDRSMATSTVTFVPRRRGGPRVDTLNPRSRDRSTMCHSISERSGR